jgi:hypothetical protein
MRLTNQTRFCAAAVLSCFRECTAIFKGEEQAMPAARNKQDARRLYSQNNMAVVPHPPYLTLFPRLNIILKGCHFDTTEVIEAELQGVMNTLTEHDSQDAFKKWQKRWVRCIHEEGDYFEDDDGQ